MGDVTIPLSWIMAIGVVIGVLSIVGGISMQRHARTQEERQQKWLTRVVAGLAYTAGVLALTMAIGAPYIVATVKPLQQEVNAIHDGKAPASVARRQDSAEQRHLNCFLARDDIELMDPNSPEVRDVKKVCEGYTTLEESYKSQGVESPKGE